LAAAAQPLLAHGQFGGGGYTPPAPICPAFKCKSGEVPVGKPEHQIWSYGCKDSGMNILDASSFDLNNPNSFKNQGTPLDKCCVEKDICKQTCGKTSKECHDMFQKCSQKTCKGNQNCQLQAMMAEIMSEPNDPLEDPAKKYDPQETQCRAYNRGQSESCMCVKKDSFKTTVEQKLKYFYGKFNSEKLNSAGEIKDVDDVWKKWTGKEPDMFMALATKYKAKAVEIRVKPKPPPYKPPPAGGDEEAAEGAAAADDGAGDAEGSGGSGGSGGGKEDRAEPQADPEEGAFDEKLAALEAKKSKAKADEDYDAAAQAKEEARALAKEEIKRLKEKKAKAVEEEDYLTAKRVKARMAKLSEL